jgi:hypothetical protein
VALVPPPRRTAGRGSPAGRCAGREDGAPHGGAFSSGARPHRLAGAAHPSRAFPRLPGRDAGGRAAAAGRRALVAAASRSAGRAPGRPPAAPRLPGRPGVALDVGGGRRRRARRCRVPCLRAVLVPALDGTAGLRGPPRPLAPAGERGAETVAAAVLLRQLVPRRRRRRRRSGRRLRSETGSFPPPRPCGSSCGSRPGE